MKKSPRTRLSMKLLWKYFADYANKNANKDAKSTYGVFGAQDFLNFVESSMKSPNI